MQSYLKAFVIGSSFLVVAVPYALVMSIDPQIRNYSYETYTFIAPIYLGLMNVFSVYLARIWNLTLATQYLLTAVVSATIVCLWATLTQMYNYTQFQWYRYYTYIFTLHLWLYAFVMYLLTQWL